jgi:hypothetical protein
LTGILVSFNFNCSSERKGRVRNPTVQDIWA